MKTSIPVVMIVLIGLVSCGNGLPIKKRMTYYQQNAQYYSGPKRMMYVQYVQPEARTYTRRSAQATSALVAGDAVATRTYIDDCAPGVHDHAVSGSATIGAASTDGGAMYAVSQQQPHDEDVLAAVGAHGSHAVAEAYPDEGPQVTITGESGSSVGYDANPATIYGAPDTVVHPEQDYIQPADAPASVDFAVNQEEQLPAIEPVVPAVPETTNEVYPTHNDDDAKVPREYNFEVAVDSPASEPPKVEPPKVSETQAANDFPAPAPIAPEAPVAQAPVRRYYPAKKKVYVELDQSVESDDTPAEEDDVHAVAVLPPAEDDDEIEEEDTYVAAIAPKQPPRRPIVKKTGVKATTNCVTCAKAGPTAKPKPLPAGTFFPINFGGTSGGAIAIANAFSTGEGGSATSHAIAYGSPDAVRARVRPQSRRH